MITKGFGKKLTGVLLYHHIEFSKEYTIILSKNDTVALC